MKSWFRSEDSLAVLLGLIVVVLSLSALVDLDLLGWSASVKVWTDPAKSVVPVAKSYAELPGWACILATYAFLLVLLSVGMTRLGVSPKRYAVRFTVLFAMTFVCWWLGHYAVLAATPEKRPPGVTWSMGLTGEAGYLLALIFGLLVGNIFPAFANWLKDAARSELFIKTAIVILGATLGTKAAEASELASSILFRGFAAIIEAYLIYWALVYLLARKVFGFSREWAAPMASGISICGVSAAIATGAAIRARPVVPIMVSSLVVVFSVMEMLVLPWAAREFLADQPMVAASWMGLSVKTDGAAVSSGAITAAMVLPDDKNGQEWMILTTTTVKVFIDMFIGIWAIILAAVWAWKIDPQTKGEKRGVPFAEIWQRFPKFVIGYLLTFLIFLAIGMKYSDTIPMLKSGTSQGNVMRQMFFVLTFFSIGLAANLRRLWAEGLGRLALVYIVSLFGFVIWIGLAISWLFFHDVMPPEAAIK